MLNDRDDNKFEGQEDSEYHFSDDDVSYEVEPEPSQPPSKPGKNGGGASRLLRSKRTWIVAVVFLGLVFLIYKMIIPSTQPSLEIAAAPATSVPVPAKVTVAAAPANSTPTPTPVNQTITTQIPAVTPPVVPPVETSATNLPPPGAVIQNGTATQNVSTPVTPTVQPTNQPQNPLASASSPQTVNAPAVIPVTSVAPSTSVSEPFQIPGTAAAQANEQRLEADQQKLLAQLESAYAEKINEFTAQNKATQDQLQTLDARVAGLETQLNQMLKAISRQNQNMSNTLGNPASSSMPSSASQPAAAQAPPPKISYNVQAIIPGRAWLKSENGDTVTVAEGDVIKDVGRVTKIDPYDGIVEINTGSRVVSLTYGSAS